MASRVSGLGMQGTGEGTICVLEGQDYAHNNVHAYCRFFPTWLPELSSQAFIVQVGTEGYSLGNLTCAHRKM